MIEIYESESVVGAPQASRTSSRVIGGDYETRFWRTAICTNCRGTAYIVAARGTIINEELLSAECPSCGVPGMMG